MTDKKITVTVDGLKMNGSGRLDADVIVGANRVHITLQGGDPRVDAEVKALLETITRITREDLAEQLEILLSPTTRKALKA